MSFPFGLFFLHRFENNLHSQAAFTIKEIRELMKLSKVAFHPVDTSLIPEDTKQLPRAARRLMDILLKGSTESLDGSAQSWSLDFCQSPKSFDGGSGTAPRVRSTTFERTTLSSPFDPSAYVSGTGELTQLPSSIVFRSIGYKSTALDGFSDMGVPFDERRGIIQNDGEGRVHREVRTPDGAMTYSNFPGLYCAGWVKRGPTGVIASTMTDAFATADAISQDWESRAPFLHEGALTAVPSGWEGVKSEIGSTGASVVQWHEWRKIDKAERERGQAAGKEREKFTSTADMLAVVG